MELVLLPGAVTLQTPQSSIPERLTFSIRCVDQISRLFHYADPSVLLQDTQSSPYL